MVATRDAPSMRVIAASGRGRLPRQIVEVKAMPSMILPYWLTRETMKAGVITAGIVFVVSYTADTSLLNLKISTAKTILNDVVIAVIATVIVVYYLSAIQSQQNFLRAKERMNLTMELNHHLRRAMVEFRNAAEIQDRLERLRMLDQVIDEVDHVLVDLVPTVSAESAPRLNPAQNNRVV
jgi:hypothetical protein